jgi:hypothetical protein
MTAKTLFVIASVARQSRFLGLLQELLLFDDLLVLTKEVFLLIQMHFFISWKLWLYGKIAKNRIRAGCVALGGVEKT